MRKIVLVNQKGGCGKTTTAINLSYCLATTGRKVLLLDLDPQGHVALGFGVRPDQIQGSIYEVLLGQMPVTQAVQALRENLDAVLSDVLLAAFEQVMAGAREREVKLKRSLEEVRGKYDYLIIDSPPSLGLLTFNALLAAEEVIIPVEPSFFSVQGLQRLLETIHVVETKAMHRLSVNILATNFDRRTRFCKDMLACLQATFPEHCLATIIRTCTALREAAGRGKPIGEYEQRCSAFADYQDLAKEVLGHEIAPRETHSIPSDLQTVDFAELVAERSQAQTSMSGAEGGLQDAHGREVVFTLTAPAHAAVQIAGDFNNWMPESLEFAESQGAQVWHKAICLKPGSYEYKYVIDGRWAVDPHNSKVVDDPYGGVNSQLNV
ncbi:MAG TPA: AAA family ATPase [Syntrophobacteria bacterium]|nr:AAA family ATPase [Syntrophobacteria bacterium]